MTDVLVILLNYRRPENLTMLIESLRRQTVRPRIAVWNNGTEREIPGVDVVVGASDNLMCLPRWHVAAMLGRQYVAVIDDDLMPIETICSSSVSGPAGSTGMSASSVGPA